MLKNMPIIIKKNSTYFPYCKLCGYRGKKTFTVGKEYYLMTICFNCFKELKEAMEKIKFCPNK